MGNETNAPSSTNEGKKVEGENSFWCGDYKIPIDTLAKVEKRQISWVLGICDGNKTHAAQSLGITTKTLYNKLHQYGLMVYKQGGPKD